VIDKVQEETKSRSGIFCGYMVFVTVERDLSLSWFLFSLICYFIGLTLMNLKKKKKKKKKKKEEEEEDRE
jgi:uncharacterized membrane protein